MKLFIAFVATFILSFQSADLETIRKEYTTAHSSKQNIENFNKLVSKTSSSIPAIAGYKAAGEVMKAKFSKGKERRNYIYDGVKALEIAILKNPNDVELRLIRLSVQEHLPKFIKYNKNIAEDKALILKNYSIQSPGLKNYIKNFAAQSKTISAAEKAKLK